MSTRLNPDDLYTIVFKPVKSERAYDGICRNRHHARSGLEQEAYFPLTQEDLF